MTSVVLAWLVITIGYIAVRATQSLNFTENKGGLMVYGILVLTVEVSALSPLTLLAQTPYLCYNYGMVKMLRS